MDTLAKNINTKNAHLFSLITMGQLTDSHKAQIVAYRNANLSMTELGRKIGFHKYAICKFFSVNSDGMSDFGDFADPMSFLTEMDSGVSNST